MTKENRTPFSPAGWTCRRDQNRLNHAEGNYARRWSGGHECRQNIGKLIMYFVENEADNEQT
jgi:hypothetical protein